MKVDLKSRSPVFDARGPQIMEDLADEAGRTVADEGVNVVRAEFAKVVQHPTGRYSRAINAVHYGELHKVDDGNMIYGGWLAGTSSLNARSRFKGYAHWRRSAQMLQRKANTIVRDILPRYVRRLRG